MRKIQCDNGIDMNVSITEDTGDPIKSNTNQIFEIDKNDSEIPINNNTNIITSTQIKTDNNETLTNDLLNDSDFDQILLKCTENIEKTVIEKQKVAETNRSPMNKTNSASEVKSNSATSSDWNLFDDEIDDLLSNVDVDITMNDSLNSSKFTRHKSMPQEQQNQMIPTVIPYQQSTYSSNANRKSFIRHESMPITNTLNQLKKAVNSVQPNSSQSSNSCK